MLTSFSLKVPKKVKNRKENIIGVLVVGEGIYRCRTNEELWEERRQSGEHETSEG